MNNFNRTFQLIKSLLRINNSSLIYLKCARELIHTTTTTTTRIDTRRAYNLFGSRILLNENRIHQLNAKHIESFHSSNGLSYTAKERAAREAVRKFVKKSQLKPVVVNRTMSVRELADAMGKTSQHVFDCLSQLNIPIRNRRDSFILNDFDLIIKIVQLSGYRYQMAGPTEVDFDKLEAELDSKDDSMSKRDKPLAKNMIRRPPLVTIMGHVDHGKTTLLDSLRGTHVVDKEFGGITQHIGAFNCHLKAENSNTERIITFLDTPGHAAFSMMRSRGAKITDIIVLVIAVEDSIMAQTIESIQHAKQSGCSIIVAINKIDKSTEAQINKVKQDLLKYDLIPEDMGGDVQVVPISALKKINLERLKEEIWTRAEVMELKGDPIGLVEGYIIEASLDAHKGKLATVLIKRGTLRRGSYLIAGNAWCKVKYIFDENQINLNDASLSQAVQVMGWKELPHPGDEVLEIKSEHRAKELIEIRHKKDALKKQRIDLEIIKKKRTEHEQIYKHKLKEKRLVGAHFVSALYDKDGNLIDESKQSNGDSTESGSTNKKHIKTLHIIVKTDVNGSLEAILNVLETYSSSSKVVLDLVHFEVGHIKKTDLELAETFDAIIYCFNLPYESIEASTEAITNRHAKNIRIKHFNVIYKLFDDLKNELNQLAPMVEQEEKIGEAQVLKLFSYDETNKTTVRVAGSRCVDGLIDRKLFFRIVRNSNLDPIVVADREKCRSLKHIKTDVNTVKRNVDFGIAFDNQSLDLQPGDKIICYSIKMVSDPIDWNLGF